MNSHIRYLFNEPVTISLIDGLPMNLYVVEYGKVDTIFYSSGRTWKNYIPCGCRIFTDLYKAYDYYKTHTNEIVGVMYMSLYNFMDDGDKEILFSCQGGNVGKRLNYV